MSHEGRKKNKHPKAAPLDERDWLFEDEVADRFGVGKSTMKGYRDAGESPPWYNPSRTSRLVRYKKVDVESFIEEQKSAGRKKRPSTGEGDPIESKIA